MSRIRFQGICDHEPSLEETARWAPYCPICLSPSVRDPKRFGALDCTCVRCGWHHTSPLRRAVLRALTRGTS
jgi:hypothetical protein